MVKRPLQTELHCLQDKHNGRILPTYYPHSIQYDIVKTGGLKVKTLVNRGLTAKQGPIHINNRFSAPQSFVNESLPKLQ